MLERIGTYNYLPVILGSSIGGLILLAVITAALYKVRTGGRAMPRGRGFPGDWGRARTGERWHLLGLFEEGAWLCQGGSQGRSLLGKGVGLYLGQSQVGKGQGFIEGGFWAGGRVSLGDGSREEVGLWVRVESIMEGPPCERGSRGRWVRANGSGGGLWWAGVFS